MRTTLPPAWERCVDEWERQALDPNAPWVAPSGAPERYLDDDLGDRMSHNPVKNK